MYFIQIVLISVLLKHLIFIYAVICCAILNLSAARSIIFSLYNFCVLWVAFPISVLSWVLFFLLYFLLDLQSIWNLFLIFKRLFIFNWRIIALQCCVGFCHSTTWISHRYTYVLSFLNLPSTSHPVPPLKFIFVYGIR